MIRLNMLQTMGIAMVFLVLGRFLRKKVSFFQQYCIPAPVIGGLIFAIFHLILRLSSNIGVEFDETLKNVFMNMFFTTIGFSASLKTLKKGGVMVVWFLVIATVLAVLQNVLAVLLAPVVGIHPVLALMTGATSMTGGHGTSGGIAPDVERLGFMGAQAMAMASATFGLLAGSIMGGPVASRLIEKKHLEPKRHENKEATTDFDSILLDQDRFLRGFIQIMIAMGLGVYVSTWIELSGLHFPSYIGGMLIAVLMRNLSDGGLFHTPMKEINVIGSVSLNLFLAVALLTMRLWELKEVAGAMVVLLFAQVVLMALFARWVTFYLMGKDYDAAVLSAGHCGFGMGATANGMANMVSVCDKYSYSKQAFFVLPIVGALFIDFTNVFQIQLFINFLK